MSEIGPTATAAREQSRDPRGKFGTQPAAEATDTTLTSGTDLDRILAAQDKEIDEASDQHEKATERLIRSSLIWAAATIRKSYPQAQTMVLEDNYEGGISWSAKDADGNVIDDIEVDGALTDDLWDCAGGIDLQRPSLLAPYGKGFDPTDRGFHWSGAIEVDKHSGSVESLEVDIDEMLARASDAPAQ